MRSQPQSDIELLFERMAVASDIASSAIADGILCRIIVDPLGLVVDASHGRGEKMLSLRKVIGYEVLKTLKNESKEQVR